MITEQQLKADCTTEIIKKMVELAEGFEFISDDKNIHVIRLHLAKYEHEDWILRLPLFHRIIFPLLIHRAVEGWNKKNGSTIYIKNNSVNYCDYPAVYDDTYYWYNDYQTSSLTPCECACLHCLIEVLG